MSLVHDTILQRLGKVLHVHVDDIAREPLPRSLGRPDPSSE